MTNSSSGRNPGSGPWGKVPRRFWEDPYLSKGAIRTYGLLRCFANKAGRAWPGMKTLADILGTERRNVQRWVRELEEYGYIETERHIRPSGGYGANSYFFPDFPPKPDAVESDASEGDAHAVENTAWPGRPEDVHVAVENTARGRLKTPLPHAVDSTAQTDQGETDQREAVVDNTRSSPSKNKLQDLLDNYRVPALGDPCPACKTPVQHNSRICQRKTCWVEEAIIDAKAVASA